MSRNWGAAVCRAHLGDRDAMVDMAVKNSAVLNRLDVDAYIGDTASCTEHYREYGSIAGDDRQVGERAREVAHHTALASDFLDRNGVAGTSVRCAGA